MPNKNQIIGLKPVGKLLSANEYVASAVIYAGDLVKIASDGKVARCAASEAAIGVALSHAAADGDKILVADEPNQRFVVQADDATIAAQTNLALNYNITVGTASTLYKRSAMQLDASTGATDSILPLKALRVYPQIDNAFGDKVDIEVVINNHQLAKPSVGV